MTVRHHVTVSHGLFMSSAEEGVYYYVSLSMIDKNMIITKSGKA